MSNNARTSPVYDLRATASKCPACNATLSAATEADRRGAPRAPRPGDVTVCAYCAAVLVFGADLKLRAATQPELRHLRSDPAIRRALRDVYARRAEIGGLPS